ncbi:hypothetical protein CWI75_14735 [Kineobactrum sediminis]|uniref:Uncharacterized protein n=1 Tax=Kineobactrum sediminis TaxID=1905677 RepID=A0A2N5XZY1_9GAMM|nr:hypothetical protein [Kineobactrum sediminis]PLW81712.1 hypothetical protein CWI75_14735 [Kineobactrum sediminis]
MIENDSSSLDADDILRTAEATLEHLETTSIGQNKSVELLRELYQKTRSFLEQEVNIKEVVFTAQEMADWVTPQGDSESSSKFVRRHLGSYEEFVAQNRDELDDVLKGAGCPGRLTVAKRQSRGAHKTFYYLSLDAWDSDENLPDDIGSVIRYRVIKFKRPLPWARMFLTVDLQGPNLWLFPLLMLIAGALGLGGLVWAIVFDSALMVAITAGLLVGWWSIVRSIWHVLGNGIATAPAWLYGLSTQTAQFEIHETAKTRPDGRPLRQFRLVVYESQCSVCAANVWVFPGKGKYRGRQVGRCSRASAEHVYSFDHITKVGVPLSETAQYHDIARRGVSPNQV